MNQPSKSRSQYLCQCILFQMRDALQWFIPSTSVTTVNHYEFGKCGHTWSQIASSDFFVAQHERKPRELRKSHSAAATVPRTFFSAFGSLEKQTTNMCILVDGKSRNSNLKIWRLRGMFPISNPPSWTHNFPVQFSAMFLHVFPNSCVGKQYHSHQSHQWQSQG